MFLVFFMLVVYYREDFFDDKVKYILNTTLLR